jgi:hypothetical protein
VTTTRHVESLSLHTGTTILSIAALYIASLTSNRATARRNAYQQFCGDADQHLHDTATSMPNNKSITSDLNRLPNTPRTLFFGSHLAAAQQRVFSPATSFAPTLSNHSTRAQHQKNKLGAKSLTSPHRINQICQLTSIRAPPHLLPPPQRAPQRRTQPSAP